MTNNHPVATNVNSHLDSQKETVTLSVKFGSRNDGSIYPSEAVLDVQEKNLKEIIENTGYRRLAQ